MDTLATIWTGIARFAPWLFGVVAGMGAMMYFILVPIFWNELSKRHHLFYTGLVTAVLVVLLYLVGLA